MANTLKKLGVVEYTPGIAPIPGQPAYCVQVRTSDSDLARVAGRHTDGGYTAPVGAWGNATHGAPMDLVATNEFASVYESTSVAPSSGTTSRYDPYTTQCYPAVAGTPGTPGQVSREDRVGWNGGARSIDVLSGEGYVKFVINAKPTGVVAGLARNDSGGVFGDVTHGVYAHGSLIDIVESGKVVATTDVSPATKPTIYIKREAGYVDYVVGGWRYRSTARSEGSVFLDAALYTTGDSVDDPVISSDLSTFDAPAGGSAELTLPSLAIATSDYASGNASLAFAPLAFSVTSSLAGLEQAALTLPALESFAGEGAGAAALTTLPALVVSSDNTLVVPLTGGADLTMPPLYGAVVGTTGTIGGANLSFPTMTALAAEGSYGESRMTLAGLTCYSDDGPAVGTYGVMQYVFSVDFALTQPTLFASVTERLELEEADAVVVLSFVGSVFEGLQLSESLTVTQMLQAIAEERLVVNSSTRQGALEAIQYAVNIATGALTTYQGFDFQGFVKVGETTYGYRADGLYKVRPGDDDGAGINAMVDFGVVPIVRDENAPAMAKTHLHDAFLGLDSDGTAYMKLTADGGVERVYRVVDRGDASRSRFGKGITAREWRVKLEIIDATDATLDGIEYLAAVSTRRWTR